MRIRNFTRFDPFTVYSSTGPAESRPVCNIRLKLGVLPDPKIVLTGLTIGFLMSAPIGPVNILVIQRAIQHGLRGGFAAGLGSVLGDGLMAFVAAFGLTTVTATITANHVAIRLIGGIVLMVFGWRLLSSTPAELPASEVPAPERNLLWLVPQTFVLTLTNPGAVLGMLALYGSAGTALGIDRMAEALIFVTGAMLGALTWWLVLSVLVVRFQQRLVAGSMARVNMFAGALLMAFGALLIGDVLLGWLP